MLKINIDNIKTKLRDDTNQVFLNVDRLDDEQQRAIGEGEIKNLTTQLYGKIIFHKPKDCIYTYMFMRHYYLYKRFKNKSLDKLFSEVVQTDSRVRGALKEYMCADREGEDTLIDFLKTLPQKNRRQAERTIKSKRDDLDYLYSIGYRAEPNTSFILDTNGLTQEVGKFANQYLAYKEGCE